MAIPVQQRPGRSRSRSTARGSPVAEGSTIWRRGHVSAGIDIPTLCHDERFDPVGVCRMCVVDVGAPALDAAVLRAARARTGMDVKTATPEIQSAAARC